MTLEREVPPSVLAQQVLAGDRIALARALPLVESSRPAHQEAAASVLDVLLPHTGGSMRVGVTGVPGVGKSTLIEALVEEDFESGVDVIKQGKVGDAFFCKFDHANWAKLKHDMMALG